MITVFTPTYNRKKLLKRCYESLTQQTICGFEWLIIDDGSDDGTKEFVKSIIKKSDFQINYVYQDNGGKHKAFNRAVMECKNDYILILDSDDMLTKDAIEVLEEKCDYINCNSKISGVIGNRGIIGDDGVMGVKMPNVEIASGLELYQKMGFYGDTLRLYKTSILKKYRFPEIKGENFVPENVVFDQIDKKYKMLVISEVLYLGEYQDGGLSSNISEVCINNPVGYSLSLKSTAETALNLRKKFGMTILYIMWARRFRIKNAFRDYNDKIIYLLCLPCSYLFQLLKLPKFYFNMFRR